MSKPRSAEWKHMNENIIKVIFHFKNMKLSVMQVYAQANDASDEVKEAFEELLFQTVLLYIPEHEMLFVIRNLNAESGNENNVLLYLTGKHGTETMVENGERLTIVLL